MCYLGSLLSCASFAALLLASGCTKASAPQPASQVAEKQVVEKKVTYGHVTDGPVVAPSQILASLDSYAGKVVRIEGKAAAVCEHRGCWMDVAGADGASIRIKVKDGEVVFPASARGKRVIAEGVVVKIPAEPAADKVACDGEHEKDEAAADHHDCTRPAGASARLDGVGAVVFDAS